MSFNFSDVKKIKVPNNSGTLTEVKQIKVKDTDVVLWKGTVIVTWKYLTSYPDTWTTVTEEYAPGSIPSRSDPSTVTSGNNRKVFASWDDLSPVTSDRTITAIYTQQYYATISPSYCTANISTGWYDSGTVITWTANNNYSFGGSTVQDTTTTTITSGTTYSKSPSYVKCTISSTNCSADKPSGSILKVGTEITWYGDYGPNYKYGWGSGDEWSESYKVQRQTVKLSTTSYSKTPNNIWYNVFITLNSGTEYSMPIEGYLAEGTTITFVANTNTSTTKYSYSSTDADTHSISGYTVSSAGQTIESPTVYNWYYVQINSTNSTAHKGSATGTTITSGSSAWYINGQIITWTPTTNYSFSEHATTAQNTSATITSATTLSKSPSYGYVTVTKTRCTGIDTGYRLIGDTTFTANTNCAYSSDGTTTTETKAVTAGGTINSSAGYIYVTVSATNCTANKSTGWHAYNTKCTWTASADYAFDNAGTSTSTARFTSAGATYDKSATHAYLTVSGSHRTVTAYDAGWYAVGSSITTTFKADAGWSFSGTTAEDTTTKTVTVPGTNSATPSYFYITINAGTGCSANQSSGFYTSSTKPSSIKWTPTTYYSFDAGTTQTSHINNNILSAPATYTAQPTNYKAASIGTSSYCTADKNTSTYYQAGTYIIWTAGSNYSFGGSLAGDTVATGPITAGGTFDAPEISYVKCTISGEKCTADKSTGSILSVGTTILWTGGTEQNCKYGWGSNAIWQGAYAYTTQTVELGTTSYSETATAWYNVSIVLTDPINYSADYTPGYLKNGTIVTITAPDNTSDKRYAFSTSDSTVHTQQKTVSSAGQTITNDIASIWMNCTFNGDNVDTKPANDWYRVGTSQGYVAATSTNLKYAFVNTTNTWSDSYANTNVTIIEDQTSYTANANYIYYNVTIEAATNCTADYSDGYLLGNTQVTFTTTTATASTRYSFSNSSSTSYTETSTVTSPGQNILSGSVYTWYYVTVNNTSEITCTITNGSDWYLSTGTRQTTWIIPSESQAQYTFNSDGSAQNSYTNAAWTATENLTINAPTLYTRSFTITVAKNTTGMGAWIYLNDTLKYSGGNAVSFSANYGDTLKISIAPLKFNRYEFTESIQPLQINSCKNGSNYSMTKYKFYNPNNKSVTLYAQSYGYPGSDMEWPYNCGDISAHSYYGGLDGAPEYGSAGKPWFIPYKTKAAYVLSGMCSTNEYYDELEASYNGNWYGNISKTDNADYEFSVDSTRTISFSRNSDSITETGSRARDSSSILGIGGCKLSFRTSVSYPSERYANISVINTSYRSCIGCYAAGYLTARNSNGTAVSGNGSRFTESRTQQTITLTATRNKNYESSYSYVYIDLDKVNYVDPSYGSFNGTIDSPSGTTSVYIARGNWS